MRLRSSVLVSILFVVTCVVGCGKPTADSLTRSMIDKMKELSTELHGVTDEASANSAAPRIKTIAADLKALKAQTDALPKLTPEQDEALKTKYEKEMQEVFGSLGGEQMRIMFNPKLSTKPLQDAMKDLSTIK